MNEIELKSNWKMKSLLLLRRSQWTNRSVSISIVRECVLVCVCVHGFFFGANTSYHSIETENCFSHSFHYYWINRLAVPLWKAKRSHCIPHRTVYRQSVSVRFLLNCCACCAADWPVGVSFFIVIFPESIQRLNHFQFVHTNTFEWLHVRRLYFIEAACICPVSMYVYFIFDL